MKCGHFSFGYGRTVHCQEIDDEVVLSVMLESNERAQHAALMLELVLASLTYQQEEHQSASDRQQAIEIQSDANNGGAVGYGHAVTGTISPEIRNWLQQYANQHCGLDDYASLPSNISDAMKLSWRTLAADLSEFAEDCRAIVTSDGRFFLGCFGNACDLSIYPDGYNRKSDYIRFGCHNLDSAAQQLMLLSGLGMICRLAKEQTR